MTRVAGTVGLVAVLLLAVLSGAVAAAPRDLEIFVVDRRGTPLDGATVSQGDQSAVTDRYGRAQLLSVEAGSILVSHPRQPGRTVEWSGSGDRLKVSLGAPVRRAIHVNGTLPGTSRWDQLLTLAESTAINAFVLDLKDESGRVFPHTESAVAVGVGAAIGAWDLAGVTAGLHANGLAVIGRIVTFQDPIAGTVRPELAVHTSGGLPFSRRGFTFLDPTDAEARGYALSLAAEACAAGVDEVQFDYVRFPDSSGTGLVYDGPADEGSRVSTIAAFLGEARASLPSTCAVGADIFGFITSIPGDGGIGQQLESVADVVDVVSPMAYPNHWGGGWFGYARPADHPEGVIDASMRDALARVGRATVRPWLQDFGGYGPAQLRAQIDAADALGLGWMVWNAGSVFTEAGFPLAADSATPVSAAPPVEESLPPSGYWDVPASSGFGGDVRWLGTAGITTGCNPPWGDDFCPKRTITRGEAATMLVRALGLPASSIDRFDDDDGTTHEGAVNALAQAGITRGCSATEFCPHRPLSRAEMAALLARALDLAPSRADTFVDDDTSSHEADIERIAAAGITHGCAPTRFCPDEPVARDQVAAFLHRAFA